MKKTLLFYFSSFILIGILLYFFSMSWMNFLFKPNLNREIDQFMNSAETLHPNSDKYLYSNLEKSLKDSVAKLPLFSSQYQYLSSMLPSFKLFKDTFSYIDFWDDILYSASTIPINFKFLNNKVLIKDSIGNILPPKAIVKSINNRDINEILDYFSNFIFAETTEERYFWVVEREYLNLYKEFFNSSELLIEYDLNGHLKREIINTVPWNEYVNWKKRKYADQFSLIQNEKTTILKINDLSYNNNKIQTFRTALDKIIENQPENLIIDITDTSGIGNNFYSLQLLLSFLTKEESYLIPEQISKNSKQQKKKSVIPQEDTYTGNLFFLISRYSIYPMNRTLIAFAIRTGTGNLIGEIPLADMNYYSNPYSEPMYNSYLIPKVNRIYNSFNINISPSSFKKELSFDENDFLKLMKNDEEEYSHFISDTIF